MKNSERKTCVPVMILRPASKLLNTLLTSLGSAAAGALGRRRASSPAAIRKVSALK
jgi:hypothetical protein